MIRDKESIASIKLELLEQLKGENAFWSYDKESVTPAKIGDELLIALFEKKGKGSVEKDPCAGR